MYLSSLLDRDHLASDGKMCLQVYIQRLGCDLNNSEAVQQAAGCAFALATEALSDLTLLQFPPSLTAAALLMSARKHQVQPL